MAVIEHVYRLTMDASGMRRGAAEAGAALQTVERSTSGATRAVTAAGTAAAASGTSWQRMGQYVTTHSRGIEQAGKLINRTIGVGMVGAVAAGSAAFVGFDSAMTKSTAIMGNLSDEMRNKMERAARDVALATLFSANEAAEAYYYLASAGLDAAASVEALPAVAAFAQAGAFDLARATELAADSTSAFGLASSDAAIQTENMTRVTDVFARASQMANASIEQFAMAVGPGGAGTAAKMFGVSVEETTATLAVFANAGVKGRRAGTAFSAMLTDIVDKAMRNSEAFTQLGIDLFDAEGNFVGITEMVRQLEAALGPMSTEAQAAALQQMGLGLQSREAALMLLGQSETIADYTAELENAGGTVQRVADNQMQSMAARLDSLKDRFMEVGITIGEHVMPWVERFARGFMTVFESFNRLPGPIQQTVLALGGIVAVGGFVASKIKKVVDAFTGLGHAMSSAGRFMLAHPGLMLGMAAATVTTVAVIHAFNAKKEDQRRRIQGVEEALLEETGVLTGNQEAWLEWIQETSLGEWLREHETVLRQLGTDLGEVSQMIRGGQGDWEAYRDNLVDTAHWTEGIGIASNTLARELDRERAAVIDVAEANVQAALSSGELTSSAEMRIRAALALHDSDYRWIAAESALRDALEDTNEETDAAAEAVGSLDDQLASGAITQDTYNAMVEAGVDPTLNFSDATDDAATALQEEEQAARDAEQAMQDLLNATIAMFNSDIAARQAKDDAAAALFEYVAAMAEANLTQEEQVRLVDEAATEMIAMADAQVRAATDMAAANGVTLDAAEQTAIYIESLRAVAQTLAPGDPLRVRLEEYIATLEESAQEWGAEITADPTDAHQNVQAVIDHWGQWVPPTPSLHANNRYALETMGATQSYWNRYVPPTPTLHVNNAQAIAEAAYAKATWDNWTPRTKYLNMKYRQLEAAGGINDWRNLEFAAGGWPLPDAPRAGIVGSPHVIVGEGRGREYVIPVDPAYRNRAIDLWTLLTQELFGMAIGAASGAYSSIPGNPYSLDYAVKKAAATDDPLGAITAALDFAAKTTEDKSGEVASSWDDVKRRTAELALAVGTGKDEWAGKVDEAKAATETLRDAIATSGAKPPAELDKLAEVVTTVGTQVDSSGKLLDAGMLLNQDELMRLQAIVAGHSVDTDLSMALNVLETAYAAETTAAHSQVVEDWSGAYDDQQASLDDSTVALTDSVDVAESVTADAAATTEGDWSALDVSIRELIQALYAAIDAIEAMIGNMGGAAQSFVDTADYASQYVADSASATVASWSGGEGGYLDAWIRSASGDRMSLSWYPSEESARAWAEQYLGMEGPDAQALVEWTVGQGPHPSSPSGAAAYYAIPENFIGLPPGMTSWPEGLAGPPMDHYWEPSTFGPDFGQGTTPSEQVGATIPYGPDWGQGTAPSEQMFNITVNNPIGEVVEDSIASVIAQLQFSGVL